MKITLDLDIDLDTEEINVNDIISLIKKFYPEKKINSVMAHMAQPDGSKKIFSGIDDLKVLYRENFKLYPREQLYDSR